MQPREFSLGRIFAAVLAVSLLTGSVAAQARDHDDHDRDRRSHRHDDDRRHWRGHEHRYYDDRRDNRRAYAAGYRNGRYDAGRYYRPHGYRVYAWHRGARLPAAYCAPRYVVSNYDAYDLYRPPRGHHWVRVDHDVVLAAIATGAIVAVVNDMFY